MAAVQTAFLIRNTKSHKSLAFVFSSVEADACLGFKGYLGKKIGNMSQISNELLGDILHR